MLFAEIEKVLNKDGDRNQFQRQSLDGSFRNGQSTDFRPRRNPSFNRERQSLRYEY